jgi:hypothetical protein
LLFLFLVWWYCLNYEKCVIGFVKNKITIRNIMSEDMLLGSIKAQKYFLRTFLCISRSLSKKCRYYIYIYIHINVRMCVCCVYMVRVRACVHVCVCLGSICFSDDVDCRKHYQTWRQTLKQRSH